jgi:hypothetical protein
MTRWIWRIALALIAIVAVGAELDRASYLRPELAIVVPQPFRSFAQPTTALLALATGDDAAAQEEARRLVRRRPIPAEHLFTLAMAEIRSGNPRAFAERFRVASTRGWRYPPLQVAAAQAALANGDVKAAANRVAALWAEDSANPSVEPLTKALLAAPGGPEAFATPLAQTHVWSDNFVARALAFASPANAMRTVIAARREGAHFDCRALGRFDRALASRGETIPRNALACR